VALANPLSSDQDVLRSSLTLPGLLGNLATNARQGRRDAGLFEIGRVFAPADGLPREERRLGLVLSGEWRGRHWSETGRGADFFDARGLVEAVAARLGVQLRVEPGAAPPFLHPGRSARVFGGGAAIGWLGLVDADLARDSGLRGDVAAAEISLEELLGSPGAAVRARSLPRFPGVNRDLSVVWPARRASAELRDLVKAAAGERLVEVAIVDRYQGPGIPEGRVSLTLGLRFQDPQRTLTGEEIQEAVSQVVAALKDAGADIRGE
jgi:phenylalanyl-tRNA synthetase beta chain